MFLSVKTKLAFGTIFRGKVTFYQKGDAINIYDPLSVNPSKFKLQYNNKNINSKVNSFSIVLGNVGNIEIKKEDVRSPISLKFLNIESILDYNISKIKATIINKNEISIDFEYLEPNAGCELQIFYTGTFYPIFEVKGQIENKKFKEIEINHKYKSQIIDYSSWILIFSMGIIAIYGLLKKETKLKAKILQYIFLIMGIVIVIFSIVSIIITLVNNSYFINI